MKEEEKEGHSKYKYYEGAVDPDAPTDTVDGYKDWQDTGSSETVVQSDGSKKYQKFQGYRNASKEITPYHNEDQRRRSLYKEGRREGQISESSFRTWEGNVFGGAVYDGGVKADNKASGGIKTSLC